MSEDTPPTGKAGKKPGVTIAIMVTPHPPGHGPDMMPDRAVDDVADPVKPKRPLPRGLKASPLKPAPPRGL
jgi:hypothetical protein